MSRYSNVSHDPPEPVDKAIKRLARKLRAARKLRGWSQKQMANEMGVSRSLVVKMEKGNASTAVSAYACALGLFGMLDELATLADSAHDDADGLIDIEHIPKRVDSRTARRLRTDGSQ